MNLSTQRTLNQLMGWNAPKTPAHDLAPKSASPTIVKVRDPVEDVEAIVEAQMESYDQGRKANRRLRRRERVLGLDEQGRPALHGRHCCFELARSIDRQLHRIKMPSDFTCEGGTVWRVETRVSEERHHVG